MSTSAIETELLTVTEVAAFLRVSKATAYRLAATGQIPGIKVGGSLRFRRSDLEAALTAPIVVRVEEAP